MKNIKFYVFVSLFSFFSSKGLSITDINFSGELDLALTSKSLPTRDRGVTAFNMPFLKLDLEVPLKDENVVFVELESAEFRDADSKRFDTQLKEAYVSLTSFLPARAELRYGFIPDFYIELQREQWDYDFWGQTSLLPLLRYKYTAWSDMGALYQGELPQDWGQWAVTVTNGEGYQQNESGPRKQAQVLLGITRAAPFYAMLSYTDGAYESYDNSFNKKSRLLAHLSYEADRVLVALEYFKTKDPANIITATAGMAGGVDVAALAGTSIEGEGGSLFGRYKMNDYSEYFLRLDYLTPHLDDRKKNLKSISTGLSYDTNDDLRWALAYEFTDYSEEFSAPMRDESQIVLATRVSF